MIEKCCKHTDNTSYNHSHKKSAKSFAKGLDKAETHLIIFSNKQQATSNKQQATSNISAQSARIKTHPQQYNFSQNNLGLVRGAASPLNPQLFVGGKRVPCQTQVSLFPPTAPYLLFNAAKGDTPLETPSVNRKAYKQRFPKSCGSLKKYTPYKFAFIASSMLDWNQKRTEHPPGIIAANRMFARHNRSSLHLCKLEAEKSTGCTFLSGVFRGRAPKQRATFRSWEKFLNFLGKITKGICTR